MEAGEVVRNRVKEKWARDEVVASMTVRLVRGVEIALIAAAAGFDTIYVDAEHASFSLETTSQICLAALDAGVTPLVRVPDARPEHVARSLEGGAMGVIAPHVRSPADARAVVEAARLPPLGGRSLSAALPQLRYRPLPADEAARVLNEATLVAVMMETVEALERVDEIAAVEGVDMLLVGANDLSHEMGLPGQVEHPRVRDAYLRTLAACRRHGKQVGVGGLASRPDLAAEYVRLGARYVSTGTDLGFLLAAASDRVKQLREVLP